MYYTNYSTLTHCSRRVPPVHARGALASAAVQARVALEAGELTPLVRFDFEQLLEIVGQCSQRRHHLVTG